MSFLLRERIALNRCEAEARCLRGLILPHQCRAASAYAETGEAVFFEDGDVLVIEHDVIVRTIACPARALVEVSDTWDARIS